MNCNCDFFVLVKGHDLGLDLTLIVILTVKTATGFIIIYLYSIRTIGYKMN